jgi:hypothetical protein
MFRVKTPRRHHPVEKRDNVMTELYLSSLDMQTYTEGVDVSNNTQVKPLKQNGNPLSFDTIDVSRDLIFPLNKVFSNPFNNQFPVNNRVTSLPYRLANHRLSNIKIIYSLDRDMNTDTISKFLGYFTCQLNDNFVDPVSTSLSYIRKDQTLVAEFSFTNTSTDFQLGTLFSYPVVSVFYVNKTVELVEGEDAEAQQFDMCCTVDAVHAFYEKTGF